MQFKPVKGEERKETAFWGTRGNRRGEGKRSSHYKKGISEREDQEKGRRFLFLKSRRQGGKTGNSEEKGWMDQ